MPGRSIVERNCLLMKGENLMLKIKDSTRNEPTKAVCDCGNEVVLTLHHDYLEGRCSCHKEYHIKVGEGVWNCCAKSENTPIK